MKGCRECNGSGLVWWINLEHQNQNFIGPCHQCGHLEKKMDCPHCDGIGLVMIHGIPGETDDLIALCPECGAEEQTTFARSATQSDGKSSESDGDTTLSLL